MLRTHCLTDAQQKCRPLDSHGPRPTLVDPIRSAPLLLLSFALTACVSKSTEVTLPLTPSGIERVERMLDTDSTWVTLRSGALPLPDAWSLSPDGGQLASPTRSVRLDEVAQVSAPMGVLARVRRSVLRGALYGSAGFTLYYVFEDARGNTGDGDNGPVVTFAGGVIGSAAGLLYGLVVPASQTIQFTQSSSLSLLPTAPTMDGLVLLRISF